MIELDGSDAGGQLVRSALALAALSGEDVEITDVRGGRSPPGLRPQHLAAVRLAAEICDADVEGDDEGSTELTVRPGSLQPGTVTADIGTAGSVTLLFDTVLPLATAVDAPLSAVARGGTDVKWSPTMAYYAAVKLPLLRRFGLNAAIDLDRTGFYPKGGGEATLRLAPSSLSPIELVERGEFRGARIYSKASMGLADRDVAERQAETAAERLDDAGLSVTERTAAYAETRSPGSALAVRLDYEGSVAGFDALGERGKPAEDVAADAVEAAIGFDAGSAAVDRHTADQLVIFLSLAGGRVRIPAVTDHVETSLDLLTEFGLDVSIERTAEGPVLVGAGA